IFKIVVDWFQQKQDHLELQTQNMQSELNFLKSQINPHFLFNTLNNLYALTLKKSDQAPEIVLKLSEMMRYMLYECNEPKVMLSKEVHYMENYLELEKIRQGPHSEINLEVNGDPGDKMIAPLMFIPFLENSFKHGLNSSITEGYVEAVLNIEEDNVHFHIENSKAPSMPRQIHKKSGGIGLVNVKRRLNILYPERYDLTLSDSPNAYRVDLKIDLD
ncbi:MAG: sensor histidine kinase, partial [Bacteroidota bacterium]